ncbi:MAG: AI-2E family transporter [Candidatus Margulisbacteria bacterium]|nr:AI-2E family transporter [Candidatus Margulisiibacteriota bacterium]
MSSLEKLESSVVKRAIVILSVIAVGFTLHVLKPVLVPCVFALFFYFLIAPFVESMHDKYACPKWLIILFTLFLLISAFVGLSLLLGLSMRTFIADSDQYILEIINFAKHISAEFSAYGFPVDSNVLENSIREFPFLEWIKHISKSVFEIVADLFLVLIFTFFLVSGKQKSHYRRLLDTELQSQIRRYLAAKFLIAALGGILTGLILNILDLQLAFMIALLTFILHFIPNVGAIIATFLPVPIALLQYGYSLKFIIVVVTIVTIHFIIGNILDPKLMGIRLGLHPAIVLLCLLFWGFVWGIPGMFLAVPITAITKLLLSRSESTLFLAKIMEGEFRL